MDKFVISYLGFTLLSGLISGKTEAVSINCNFENGLCNWKNRDQNCFNWTTGHGVTTDKTSGPENDHTTGSSNGSYALIYGRKARDSSCKATLQSPNIRVSPNEVLSFWYHMNGNGIGNLTVYTYSNGVRKEIWQKSGRQGPEWLSAIIPITTGTTQIEFEATAKYRYGSDLAIDDVAIQSARSSIQTTAPTTKAPHILQLPFQCDFEHGLQLCQIETDNDVAPMVSWELKKSGEIFKNHTYTKGDNTTGKGTYLSLTVKNNQSLVGDKANLYLPAVLIPKMSCLTFAYSLPYKMSGSIQVFQKDLRTQQDKLVRQVSGNHGERWESTFVQFYPSSDPYQVIIEGSYSGEPGSIVDIDDIHFIEGICDGFVTTPLPTTPTTTPTMPPMSIRETPSCQPTYAHLENDLSCDFASDFCKYSQVQSPLMWEHWNTTNGGWFGKVPARSDNSSYLTTNVSNWLVRNKTAILKSPEISLKTICFQVWYSLPAIRSNLRIDIETSWGHVENLFDMEKSLKRGAWTKQSFIISHSANYKLLFSTTKIVSSSLVGLDDIKVYSKELTTGTTPGLSTTQMTSKNVTPTSEKTSTMLTATTTKLTPTSPTVTSTSAKVTSTSMRATPTSTKITPTATKVTPTTTKVTPTTMKAMPTTTKVTPTTGKVASTSSIMTEHVTNKTTVVIKSSPSASTTTPTSVPLQAGTTPGLSTTQMTSKNVTPTSEKTSTMLTATTTKLTPTSPTVTSTSAKVTSTSMRATPTSTKITPTATKVTPTTTKVTPTTMKAMPTTTKVTPTTSKVATTSSIMTEHVTNKTTVVIKSSPSASTTTLTSVPLQELSTTVPKSSSTATTTQQGTGLSSEKAVITTPSSRSPSSSRTTPTPEFSTSSTTIASAVKKTIKIDLTKSTSIKPKTTKKTDDNKETTKIYEPTKKGQNVETKGEMNKSEETLSKGTKAGIGVAVSLVGIGVIIAIFLILKNKKIKTDSIATTQEDNNACALQMVKLNN